MFFDFETVPAEKAWLKKNCKLELALTDLTVQRKQLYGP